MTKMKRFLFLIMIFCGSLQLFGQKQQEDSLLLNKKLSFGMVDYWKYMYKEHRSLSFGLLYNVVNFPNAANNNLIKQKWSFSFKTRVTLFPAILDIGMFMSKFKVNNIYQIPLYQPDKYSLVQRFGADFSLSICPLPRINRISEIIVPYAGFGYHISELHHESNDDWLNSASSISLDAWMWKIGCNIYIKKIPFEIMIEYMQTIHKDKQRTVSFLSFGFTAPLKLTFRRGRTPQKYID